MRVENVTTNNTGKKINFGINVGKTKVWDETMEYMKRNSHPKNGFYDCAPDVVLIKKIVKALKQHPSKEVLTFEQTNRYKEMFNGRGVVSSSRATYIDTEPARSDSIAPILNIVRRTVDPENKTSFNKLVGEQYEKDYQPWWDKNIKPIWGSISERFRENTFFEGNHDKKFNQDFNAQSGEKTVVTPVLINGMFAHYNKKPPVEETSQALKNELYPNKSAKKENSITKFLRKNIFINIFKTN